MNTESNNSPMGERPHQDRMAEADTPLLLSVIVPIYNVEHYLPRCLDSLLRQGMQPGEWEIICVDDGSPDGSAAIAQRYVDRHPEIFRLIHQPNQGQGAARNTGVRAARGEWVTALDSDDYLVDGAYAYVCRHFLPMRPDVVHCQHKCVWTDGITLADPDARPDGEVLFDGDGAEEYKHNPLTYVWSKFYRRAFLREHNIWSDSVIFEDELFNFAVFSHHPRLLTVSSSTVRYEIGKTDSALHIREKSTVLKQLDQIHYTMGVMAQYLTSSPDGDMAEAARRNIGGFLRQFRMKVYRTRHLTLDEWKRHVRTVSVADIVALRATSHITPSQRVVDRLATIATCHYVGYRLFTLFYSHIFEPYIQPRILAAYWKNKGT